MALSISLIGGSVHPICEASATPAVRQPFAVSSYLQQAFAPRLALARLRLTVLPRLCALLRKERPIDLSDYLAQEELAAQDIPELTRSLTVSDHVFSPNDSSTRMFREFIQRHPDWFMGKRVLELGTGTGILAFLLAQSGARSVVAVDVAEAAVDVAKRNLASFDLAFQQKILISRSNLYERLPELTGQSHPKSDVVEFNHPIRQGGLNAHIPQTISINAGKGFEVLHAAIKGLPNFLEENGNAFFWVAVDANGRADYWSPDELRKALPMGWGFEPVDDDFIAPRLS